MKNSMVMVMILAGCGAKAPQEAEAPTPVHVQTVLARGTTGIARYSGSIEPKTRVDLAFRVSGYVSSLAQIADQNGRRAIQEGDRVKKGMALAALREADYQAQLAGAIASLSEANASARQAELDADRAARLYATKSISKAEADAAETKKEAAIARAAGAQARVREARLALTDSALMAPMDGVVLRRAIEIGTLVSPGAPAISIADTSAMKVVFAAPESIVNRLSTGGSIAVEVPALAERLEATITRIAPSADRNSRTFEVEATLDNAGDRLKAGMVASLSLSKESGAPLLALPLTAIVRSPQDPRGFAVFVAKGDDHATAELREVALGEIVGNAVQVKAGLESGEKVVSVGASLLVDGAAIRVIPEG